MGYKRVSLSAISDILGVAAWGAGGHELEDPAATPAETLPPKIRVVFGA